MRTSVDAPVILVGLDRDPHEANLPHAFDRAAELAHSVLCFEDLDALVGEGPSLSQFLNLLDGLSPLAGVLVIATTNRPDRIDPAIAKRPSRFDRVYFIPEPDRALRASCLERELGAEVGAGIVSRLASKTDAYSIAFLKELVLQARLSAIRRGEERVS
ncbi:ATP-binding protein [bacterium]|nr:ATP-binding protein [bacterium]